MIKSTYNTVAVLLYNITKTSKKDTLFLLDALPISTATYTVTQDDVDNGSVENLAVVNANDENDDPLEETESTNDIDNPGKPGENGYQTITTIIETTEADLSFTKEVDLSTAELGEELTYTFTVENTGTEDLFDVEITDNSLPGLSDITYTWPGDEGELAMGETLTATATYTVTQDDVDNGSVENLAVVNANDENDDPLEETESTNDIDNPGKPGENGYQTITTIIETTEADLSFTKEVDLSTAELGEELTYTFTVENTGTEDLFDVEITDNSLPGLSDITYTWPGDEGELAMGETLTATATYTVTQDDVDNGSVENLAVVNANDENDDPLEETESTNDIDNPGKPGENGYQTITTIIETTEADLSFTKEVDLSTAELGEELTYTFTVENTGTEDLFDVEITDNSLPGLSDITYTWPGDEGELAMGETLTATATYTVTQDDVDNGSVENLAVVNANDENDDPLEETESTNDIDNPGKPGENGIPTITTIIETTEADLSFTKEVDLSTAELGEELTYTFTVENTGTEDLFDVEITDNSLPGLSDITYTWPGDEGELAMGETLTATATYTVTQDDVDNGSVENLAVVNANDENDDPLEETESTNDIDNPGKPGENGIPTITTIIETTEADLSFTKEVDLSTAELGEELTYTFTVENTGTEDLFDVEITDNSLPGLSDITYTWPGDEGELAMGETLTATATYTVTQDDVDNGSVENLAVVNANDENDDPLEETEPTNDIDNPGKPGENGIPTITTIIETTEADLSFTKEVDLSTAELGEELTYTFTVENTGTGDLFDVEITDNSLPGLSDITYTWPGDEGEMAMGESLTATATYTVTQDDVDNGSVENLAVVNANDENDDPLEETESTNDIDNPGKPGENGIPTITTIIETTEADLSFTKEVDLSTAELGEELTYTFTVENTGTEDLFDVEITDNSLPGLSDITYTWPGDEGELAMGETLTATEIGRASCRERDQGRVENVAVGNANDENDDRLEETEYRSDNDNPGKQTDTAMRALT